MNSLICSNFNLLNKNIEWEKLKDFEDFKFDDYNNFLFSLNDRAKISKYKNIYFLCYINSIIESSDNLNKVIKFFKKKSLEHKDKNFFIFLLYHEYGSFYYDKLNQQKIYNSLYDKSETINNLKILKINTSKNDVSLRNLHYVRSPLTINLLKKIVNKINLFKKTEKIKRFKLIILDCDNTLWGGVVGEDGIRNISYGSDGDGSVFKEIQNYLKFLKNSGILLSISSKNNKEIVWKTFKQLKMALGKNDFISPKINWDPKELNIKKILKSLSLRSKDVLFIDDNFIEIKKVKRNIKGINAYHVDDLIEYLNFLRTDKRLQIYSVLREDIKKIKQYKIREKYENLVQNKKNDKVFKSLKQKVTFSKVNNKTYQRTHQLFHKVNQFNFLSNRYSFKQLDKILNDRKFNLRLISFEDKFGDHGVIGLYNYKIERDKIIINDFLMSCRVINRKIEEYVIYCLNKIKKNKELIIKFKPNDSNKELIKNFLNNECFSEIKKNKNTIMYKITNSKSLSNVKDYFI